MVVDLQSSTCTSTSSSSSTLHDYLHGPLTQWHSPAKISAFCRSNCVVLIVICSKHKENFTLLSSLSSEEIAADVLLACSVV